jgi:hypothetical protein
VFFVVYLPSFTSGIGAVVADLDNVNEVRSTTAGLLDFILAVASQDVGHFSTER